jgi:hypothetical protein
MVKTRQWMLEFQFQRRKQLDMAEVLSCSKDQIRVDFNVYVYDGIMSTIFTKDVPQSK